MFSSHSFRLLTLGLALSAGLFAQQQANEVATVPRLIRFDGSYHSATQAAQTALVGAIFSIYREQNDGAPLWSEIQNVELSPDGKYSVLLGAATSEGIPARLFSGGESRWLQVELQIPGQAPQPRVLLASVPYALRAADAETIGGKPLSAFVLAGENTGPGNDGLNYLNTAAISGRAISTLAPVPAASDTEGTAGFLGMFTDSNDLGNSVVFQSGSSIGIGTVNPAATFHSAATAAPGAFFDVYSNSLSALPVVYRAARGTPQSPSAVQTDDILGGLAVRGYGATGFTSGRGQVMFRAAENWTDTANGTYLQLTTTPIGGSTWVERMRIDPSGNVGIGTTTPGGKLEVAGNLKVSGSGSGISFPDGTIQTTAVISPAGGNTNAALGALALAANTTGADNTATGAGALQSNNVGGYNTAAGYAALYSNTTGSANTATGEGALYNNTAGGNNTATGLYALYSNTTGGANTAAGYSALDLNSSGSANTAIGESAGYSLTTGNYNINIGYAVSGSAGEASTIRIGGAGYQNRAFIAGISGTTTGLSGAVTVVIDANGQLGTVSSSRRFKEDVRDMNDASSGLFRLRPVTFRYRKPYADGSKPLDYGLIAEEVADVYPDLVVRNADGQIETVQYHKLTPMLLNELQKQHAELAAQKEAITSQREEISSQKMEITILRERLARLEAALERISTTSGARP